MSISSPSSLPSALTAQPLRPVPEIRISVQPASRETNLLPLAADFTLGDAAQLSQAGGFGKLRLNWKEAWGQAELPRLVDDPALLEKPVFFKIDVADKATSADAIGAFFRLYQLTKGAKMPEVSARTYRAQ